MPDSLMSRLLRLLIACHSVIGLKLPTGSADCPMCEQFCREIKMRGGCRRGNDQSAAWCRRGQGEVV